ncbi:MAG: glycosyltransferase family 2 protein [Paludibacter sp.]|nr:glycosyltransferase family 2 protein [Paludibacter sp.]
MKASVVILNWNGEKFLKQFLPFLLNYTKRDDVEIVVADNASTDGSIALLESEFSQVRIIRLDKNYGFAGGYNKALAQIEAEYFVLLNSDVEVSEGWLDTMLDYMEANKDVVACQPKIRSFHRRNYFEHAGAAGGYLDFLGFPFCRGRVLGVVEEDNGQYDEIADIFWATGACMVIRAEIYNKVGGLDDDFFAHMEEIDLCWRLNARGYRLVCIPQSVVYHIGGGTLNSENPHKTYLNYRNNLIMLYKNLPQKVLNEIMSARRYFDYIAALQLFVTGKFANAKSVWRARQDFLKMQGNFDEKRQENILYATRTECPTLYQKSIVVEYYLKAKKTYTKLMSQI